MELRVVADPSAAAALAAEVIARRLTTAVRRRGMATIAVSGGTTPALMLAHLALAPLPWRAITVFQVDERVAPDGDADRNLPLLDALATTDAHIEAMPVTCPDLVGAAARYARALPERLDIVHLGLGDDGHTASWPPGDPVVDVPSSVAMSGEYRGRVRMTLTPRSVNSARFRLVLATGGSKAGPVGAWLAGDRSIPIGRVHRTDTMLVVDRDAAPASALDR